MQRSWALNGKSDLVISIASGKGGTGKTTVAVCLASVIKNSNYIDCDVEEPNGHLFMNPIISKEVSIHKYLPQIENTLCDNCGKCAEVCEYNALINIKSGILIINELCHSCGTCEYFCPSSAIKEIPLEIGKIRFGETESGIGFIDGILNVGEISAVPLIKSIKEKSVEGKINIVDSPPGTSCSMVEAVKDTDYCILVTESTPFGLNDLKLAINVIRELSIPFGVIINKYDPNFIEMDNFLESEHINILGKIPFERKLAKDYSEGIIPINKSEKLKTNFQVILEQILNETQVKLSNE